jgi:hypothetical protein
VLIYFSTVRLKICVFLLYSRFVCHWTSVVYATRQQLSMPRDSSCVCHGAAAVYATGQQLCMPRGSSCLCHWAAAVYATGQQLSATGQHLSKPLDSSCLCHGTAAAYAMGQQLPMPWDSSCLCHWTAAVVATEIVWWERHVVPSSQMGRIGDGFIRTARSNLRRYQDRYLSVGKKLKVWKKVFFRFFQRLSKNQG